MSPDQLKLFELPTDSAARHSFQSFRNKVWTEHKAKLIQRYLYYFVLITKHGTYIDGFAGPQSPNQPDSWAAKLVLESEPRWFRNFFVCDNDPKQVERLESLKSEQPPEPRRHIEVVSGDFNITVDRVLASELVKERTATFCLIDQRTFECDWRTLDKIAARKSDRKIELFYFFSVGWLDRAISGLSDKSTVLEKWWGNSHWEEMIELHKFDRAGLLCTRFEEELGYTWAKPWPIFETAGGKGRIMYFMIHGTDHPEAPNLMARAYRKATGAIEPPEQFELEFELWRAAKNEPSESH